MNGRVLVVAGRSTGGDSTAAELYDPVSNSWSSAGNITVARTGQTAVLLPSGKVLVWGGFGPAGVNPPAELYDPKTNSWSVIPGTNQHFVNVATLLADGRVLALGDIQNCNFQFAGILDPNSAVWMPAAKPPISMANSVVLNNGRVLFYGSCDPGNPPRAAEEYDPTTDEWSPVAPMSIALSYGQSIQLRDGSVLVAGSAQTLEPGCGSGCPNAEVFDPVAGTWMPTRPMHMERDEQTMTLLVDGRVLVAGGLRPPNPDTTAAYEIFDPAG